MVALLAEGAAAVAWDLDLLVKVHLLSSDLYVKCEYMSLYLLIHKQKVWSEMNDTHLSHNYLHVHVYLT